LTVFSGQIDVMCEAQTAFLAVGDLLRRGHYVPDNVSAMRETAPRPPSETEKFLPGQRVAFAVDGEMNEHMIAHVIEWDRAEALIVERPTKALRGEQIEWKLSELAPGTVRISVEFQAHFGALEGIAKKAKAKKFYSELLRRLKTHLEDGVSFAKVNTYAPRA